MANLVEKIADSMESLGVKRSYGDPMTVDGIEVIPVALTWFGYGAGSDDEGEGSSGGGGGGASIPVGVYSTGPDGTVRFEPNLIALLAVAIPLTWVSGKAFSAIIKALKK